MAHFIEGPHTEFAARLHNLRTLKSMTQDELAQAIGIHRRTISEYENGRMFPRGNTLRRLARTLEVDALFLARGVNPEMLDFISAQHAERNVSNLKAKVEMIFIEQWETLAWFTPGTRHPHYNSNATQPWQSADLSRFIPVVAHWGDRLRASRYPRSIQPVVGYSLGSVVVFGPELTPQDIASGNDIIYASLSEPDRPPQIRRLFRADSELSSPLHLLVSLDPNCTEPPMVADLTEIKIIGVVVGHWSALATGTN